MNNIQDVALHPLLPHPRPFSFMSFRVRLREKGEKPLARRRERGWGEGA